PGAGGGGGGSAARGGAPPSHGGWRRRHGRAGVGRPPADRSHTGRVRRGASGTRALMAGPRAIRVRCRGEFATPEGQGLLTADPRARTLRRGGGSFSPRRPHPPPPPPPPAPPRPPKPPGTARPPPRATKLPD